jgi:hypothetical protein
MMAGTVSAGTICVWANALPKQSRASRQTSFFILANKFNNKILKNQKR